ncbi:unnamed protein product [Rotaria sp. Silwood1]|nr:unnamed protein product [Rotaria sp. Silwood1]
MATGNYYRFTVKVNIVVSQTQDWIGVKSRKLPIALGDFNNDNQLDIIVTQRDDKKIHIFLGYAHGAFAVKPTTSVTSSSLPYSIAVGDFNNDNWLDFVVAHYAPQYSCD